MNSRLIESVCRRLLAEGAAPSGEGLGAHVSGTSAVIFKADPESVREITSTISRGKGGAMTYDKVKALSKTLLKKGFIVGYVSVRQNEDPCWDSWEVSKSAGPGLGKIVYGVAYALTPNGRLSSDRNRVSPSASAGWAKAAAGRKSLPFDDVDDPKTPPTEDDCRLHRGDGSEHLNAAYEAEGWERGMLRGMETRGRAALGEIESALEKVYSSFPATGGDELPTAGTTADLVMSIASFDYFRALYGRG